jgi:hypothetical protein
MPSDKLPRVPLSSSAAKAALFGREEGLQIGHQVFELTCYAFMNKGRTMFDGSFADGSCFLNAEFQGRRRCPANETRKLPSLLPVMHACMCDR